MDLEELIRTIAFFGVKKPPFRRKAAGLSE
jgi:hypothetical protein